MSRQKVRNDRIRRCIDCGAKTHARHWLMQKMCCPICGSAKGWVPSTHGAMTELEITESRLKRTAKYYGRGSRPVPN